MERRFFKGLVFETLDRENLETAVAVQRQIFPREDAKQNFLDFVKNGPKRGYGSWLIKLKDECIGVVGLYHYPDYPEDAWLGFFGITEKNRKKGYGSAAFDFFVNEAVKLGFKNIRLYTDDGADKDAVSFYKRRGMTGEIYSNRDDRMTSVGNIVIFSKNLSGGTARPWDNKRLGLKEQEKRQNTFKGENTSR